MHPSSKYLLRPSARVQKGLQAKGRTTHLCGFTGLSAKATFRQGLELQSGQALAHGELGQTGYGMLIQFVHDFTTGRIYRLGTHV